MKILIQSACVLATLLLGAPPAFGGDPEHVARIREAVAFDQKLGADLDLSLAFLDEEGRAVKLGDYFGRKPVLVTPVYFGCPQLCTQVLTGLVNGLKEMSLEPGRDFEIVTFSINPLEKPELAREKKAAYLELLGKPDAAAAWHFLTADPARNVAPKSTENPNATDPDAWHNPSVDALTASLGFRYAYDPEIQQYAHAAGVVVATPEGKSSKYLYGIHFLPRDLRLSIVDSSNGKVGSLADQLFLWICYHYDPLSGKYSFAVVNTVRACAVLTVLALIAYVVIHLRRERVTARLQAGG
ncbi:MAG: SCO family protein [Planctomycetes bacterium]|nr:SCO family protein [Planctomycetota bacterium]